MSESDEAGRGVRTSPKRAAILAALTDVEDFLSAQDVHARLRNDGQKVGLATVYRSLQALHEAGQLDAIRTESGEVSYRHCTTGQHHHHLICRVCGRTVEVAGPAVERWAEEMAAAHGYTDVSHTLEIFGICSAH